MKERKLVGAQADLLPGIRFPHIPQGLWIIFRVTDDGAADICQLYTDLVVPAGENVDK